jgi:hypothetical protein
MRAAAGEVLDAGGVAAVLWRPAMLQPTNVSTIAHLIQLAIAPVFLLAGIGAILNVLAQRLARVVDRARALEKEFESLDDGERARAGAELLLLDRRMSVVNQAISACTASALFVCLVVGILFVADLANINWGRPIAVLFIIAMLLLTVGLLLFLYEIRLAARSLRVRQEFMPHRRKEAP